MRDANTSASLSLGPLETRPLQSRLLLGAIAVLTIASAYVGFRAFWFLTDDAFITFRYASNLVAGRGLVWNPAPFTPVEGYTSFLFTVLLSAIWKLTGILPPNAANWLSFGCGLGTLLVVARIALRLELPRARFDLRIAVLVLVLIGTLTNRTFLTFLSSGLETALFNLLLTCWVALGFRRNASADLGGAIAWTTTATLLALTRPDGLLFAALTAPGLWVRARAARAQLSPWAFAPFALIALHLAFRYATYGELLPNTYYAKRVAAWPQAGLIYASAFVLEYAMYVWLVLFAVWVSAALRTLRPVRDYARMPWRELLARAERFGTSLVVVGALLAHLAYYTLIIGGDHFEFRVYSHLVPLLFLSAGVFASRAFARLKTGWSIAAVFLLLSWPIPWTHWLHTRDINTRADTKVLVFPVASLVPGAMWPVAAAWDATQAWLIPHYVGRRHQEHKVFWQRLSAQLPPRGNGAQIAWASRSVITVGSVGVVGWRLPNVAVIDLLGLNDRVVARTPLQGDKKRKMAHDRAAPPGYAECFRADVLLYTDGISIKPRDQAFTDADIRACEQRFGATLKAFDE